MDPYTLIVLLLLLPLLWVAAFLSAFYSTTSGGFAIWHSNKSVFSEKALDPSNSVAPKPKPSLLNWGTSIVKEAVVVTSILTARALHPFLHDGEIIRKPHEKRPPVILIHGYVCSPLNWWYFKRCLKHHNVGTLHAISLNTLMYSIEALASHLEDYIQKIGANYFHLVCHSMGGVVAVQYLLHHAKPGQVLSLTLMGSPMGGTLTANITLARQMVFDNNYIKKLRDKLKQYLRDHPDCQLSVVWSLTDSVVVPADSARVFTNLERELRFENVGHGELMYRSDAAREISKWIEHARKTSFQRRHNSEFITSFELGKGEWDTKAQKAAKQNRKAPRL